MLLIVTDNNLYHNTESKVQYIISKVQLHKCPDWLVMHPIIHVTQYVNIHVTQNYTECVSRNITHNPRLLLCPGSARCLTTNNPCCGIEMKDKATLHTSLQFIHILRYTSIRGMGFLMMFLSADLPRE